VDIQFEDAQGDIGKQLNQIQNFIAQKVDSFVWIPFQLVTKDNYKEFLSK
jgi:ABC-type sugar transport system substrate-binding protein